MRSDYVLKMSKNVWQVKTASSRFTLCFGWETERRWILTDSDQYAMRTLEILCKKSLFSLKDATARDEMYYTILRFKKLRMPGLQSLSSFYNNCSTWMLNYNRPGTIYNRIAWNIFMVAATAIFLFLQLTHSTFQSLEMLGIFSPLYINKE